jgi:hypothetical protein
MMPNGAKVIYRYNRLNDDGVVEETGPLPLEAQPLDPDINRWQAQLAKESESWPTPWQASLETACSIGTRLENTRSIPETHPQAIAHLARFHGQTCATDYRKFDGLSGHWGVTLGIIKKRLDGVVSNTERFWHNAVDQTSS